AASRQFFYLLCFVSGLLHLLYLFDPLFSRARITLKPVFQALIDNRTHNTLNWCVIETVFGLSLELGIAQLDRDNCIQPLLDNFWSETILLTIFDDLPFKRIIMADLCQRSLKTCFMNAPISSTHSIGKTIHCCLIPRRRLQGRVYLYSFLFFRYASNFVN